MHKRMRLRLGIGCSLFVIFLLSGCITPPPEPTVAPTTEPTATPVASTPLTDAFPGANDITGWIPEGALEVYDSETIFNLVDGQADFFFAYGFERVAAWRYRNADEIVLDIQIWQLSDDANAYGLFSAGVAGEPVSVCPQPDSERCSEGDADPGRRLVFWQDRYVAQVFARKTIPDSDLQRFGAALAAALPSGGERPALLDRLPAEGLIPRSAVFFHEELSIQNELWLGGENVLGLGPDTNGVLARYEIDGAEAHLLLIAYPSSAAAAAGLTALQGSEIEGPVTADVNDMLLGAVLGQVSETSASTILTKALGD